MERDSSPLFAVTCCGSPHIFGVLFGKAVGGSASAPVNSRDHYSSLDFHNVGLLLLWKASRSPVERF